MLINYDYIKDESYGFRFKGGHQQRVAGLYVLGKEKQNSTSYNWDGLNRSEQDIVVFQYTLKGAGKIRIGQRTHDLHPGEAFFIHIPSDHTYYLPAESDGWEFIYITLFGDEVYRCYETITKEIGHVFELDVYSPPIQTILHTLEQVAHQQLDDAYSSSATAYAFLMQLYAAVFHTAKEKALPAAITKARVFMDNNYDNLISLDDIVAASGLSKYHFTRLFHKGMNATPIQYLTKLRINKAMELLKNEQLTVEAIALKVGFSNGNYFTKVFRSYLGVAPSTYRNSKIFSPVDYLISD
ncbi:AraC-like DNA-binding protein [Virgibacillus halotolerans]|uniref:AraC family transcriptional regulator n=1 Tax=Virgibacillus halotolerans TaxID=1071053 RepID=UPI0019603411|nr:AraC family transcriptional regulator [Virgibacillus halotolerans]MBM7600045.1 AraC-like DNA-binding protein [Virgibacillus halotolerans]